MEKKEQYLQMEKNTVDSRNQLKENDSVRFHHLEGDGVRIMFVGNSITLHSCCPSIGWNLECGMAASAVENDYVHILEKDVLFVNPDASFCICHVSGWESNYKNGSEKYPIYQAARAFDADIIVVRFIENCDSKDFDSTIFRQEFEGLINYLNADGEAKIIVTTGFWRHPGDAELFEYAKDNSLPFIELGDLGEDDKMKATGLFKHEGVANHPGDLGMKSIAERIAKELIPLCKK